MVPPHCVVANGRADLYYCTIVVGSVYTTYAARVCCGLPPARPAASCRQCLHDACCRGLSWPTACEAGRRHSCACLSHARRPPARQLWEPQARNVAALYIEQWHTTIAIVVQLATKFETVCCYAEALRPGRVRSSRRCRGAEASVCAAWRMLLSRCRDCGIILLATIGRAARWCGLAQSSHSQPWPTCSRRPKRHDRRPAL